jgi:hypothetical protein
MTAFMEKRPPRYPPLQAAPSGSKAPRPKSG